MSPSAIDVLIVGAGPSGSTAATALSNLYTNYTYDALQRVTKIADANGNTTNSYYKWEKTATDPNGNIKDYWSDAFGNLANVVEHNAGLATTTYTYDTLNNLATTTDELGNVRAIERPETQRKPSIRRLACQHSAENHHRLPLQSDL